MTDHFIRRVAVPEGQRVTFTATTLRLVEGDYVERLFDRTDPTEQASPPSMCPQFAWQTPT